MNGFDATEFTDKWKQNGYLYRHYVDGCACIYTSQLYIRLHVLLVILFVYDVDCAYLYQTQKQSQLIK